MIARNKVEEKALELMREGKPIHGLLRDILIDMQLREMEERGEQLD